MSELLFSFSTDSYSNEFELVSYSGTESISSLFNFNLFLKVKHEVAASMDFSTIVEEGVKLSVKGVEGRIVDGQDGKDTFEIIGVLQSIQEEFQSSTTHKYYSATMVPSLSRQTQSSTYDIYVNKDVLEILKEELDQDILIDYDLVTSRNYPPKPFICQYAESNFNFMARQAAHWGIYYYFDHDNGGQLVFADDTNYVDCTISDIKLDESNNPSTSFNTVRTLQKLYNSVPQGVVVAETNPDQASESFIGTAGDVAGKNCLHLVNEGCEDKDEAMQIADIRFEEAQSSSVVYTGTTGIPCVIPGCIMNITDAAGVVHDVLVTQVSHSGSGLDNSHRIDSETSSQHYEAQFVGIPSDVQYRPNSHEIPRPQAISTTARIHSDDDEKNIAQRNDVGKYQVIFDFLKDEKKVSHWVRLARHTARTNHFDMPLTPGTEVQMSFVGGNPDKPFIQSALENSQSVRHSVTNANPHHASIRTDGALYTETVKSYQNLHVSASHDMADVHEYISGFPLKELDAAGADSGDDVDEVVGHHHIRRRFGDRYSQINGVDFNYGLNANFNFGQQYTETHAEEDSAIQLDFSLDSKLVGETSVAENFDESLADERKAGIVNKDFGNKYSYHTGDEYTWAQGKGQSGGHSSYHFGGRTVENHADLDANPNNSCDSTVAAPSGDDAALVTKNFGDTYQFIEGADSEGHVGDKLLIRNGATEETMTGDITRTVTGNITDDITGDITETFTGAKVERTHNISGDITQMVMAAGKIEFNTTAGAEISSIEMVPSKKATVTGDENWINAACKSSVVVGVVNENFIGGKLSTFGGLASENFLGVKMSLHSGVVIENKNKGRLGKNQMDIQEAKTAMLKKAKIITLTASLMMLG